MKKGKLRISRKGLSPIIAILLAATISVGASIVAYVWSMALFGLFGRSWARLYVSRLKTYCDPALGEPTVPSSDREDTKGK